MQERRIKKAIPLRKRSKIRIINPPNKTNDSHQIENKRQKSSKYCKFNKIKCISS